MGTKIMGGHEYSEMEEWSVTWGLIIPTLCKILLVSTKKYCS